MCARQEMLGFSCDTCGHFTTIGPKPMRRSESPSALDSPREPAETSSVPEALESATTVECPKCQRVQPRGEPACHRCGLSFAYAATGRAQLPPDPLAGHPDEDQIRARWEMLRHQVGDKEGHEAFIQTCTQLGLLNFAGQSYRHLMDEHPDDERIAEYRQRVIGAAMARAGRLEAKVQTYFSQRSRSLLILCFGALILLGFAIGYYLISRSQTAWQFNG